MSAANPLKYTVFVSYFINLCGMACLLLDLVRQSDGTTVVNGAAEAEKPNASWG
jgi:hypothetical protein